MAQNAEAVQVVLKTSVILISEQSLLQHTLRIYVISLNKGPLIISVLVRIQKVTKTLSDANDW